MSFFTEREIAQMKAALSQDEINAVVDRVCGPTLTAEEQADIDELCAHTKIADKVAVTRRVLMRKAGFLPAGRR
jgi:hypothetical protein